jgi:hypothetical protein
MSRKMSVLALGVMTLGSMACQRSTAPSLPASLVPPSGCVEVKGSFNPAAPGFIVSYRSGVDPIPTTAELEAKYAFSAKHVYTALPGFAAQLSNTALAGVRCESVVASMSYDGVGTIAQP